MEELASGGTIPQSRNERLHSHVWEVAQVRKAIDENYQQTKNIIGGPQTQAQFEGEYTDGFDQRPQLFASRIENNWIRECHGDLHLRNICFWQGKILLFDRIESAVSLCRCDVRWRLR